MEIHPEQRFQIARDRHAEKVSRGVAAYDALRAVEEDGREEPVRSPRRLLRLRRPTASPTA